MTNINQERNLTLLMDFYELTMAAGYFEEGYADKVGVFDMFFRKIPDDGGFAIAAGLEQFCQIIDNLHFSDEDIAYLQSKGCFFPALFGLPAEFPVPLHHLGGGRGHAHLPGRTHRHCGGPGH